MNNRAGYLRRTIPRLLAQKSRKSDVVSSGVSDEPQTDQSDTGRPPCSDTDLQKKPSNGAARVK